MTVNRNSVQAHGFRFSVEHDDREVAHAYLYIMSNEAQPVPFGLMDDVIVDVSVRGQGIGTELVDAVIEAAKAEHCYKLLGISRDSRPEIDELYRRRGFFERGTEFRIDLR